MSWGVLRGCGCELGGVEGMWVCAGGVEGMCTYLRVCTGSIEGDVYIAMCVHWGC